MRHLFILCLFVMAAAISAALTFVNQPSITKNGADWTVRFEVSDSTDVEVSIVNVSDSSVIRHLVAGRLGANAPAPLQKNSLSQTLLWNGKDDFGAAVVNPDSLSVRVRAGMSTRLAQTVGEDLYLYVAGGRASPSIILEEDGSVMLFGKASSNSFLRKYDPAGNYAKTIYPPAAGLPSDSVVSYGINVIPGGGWAPKITAPKSPTMTNSYLNDQNTVIMSGGPGKLLLINGNNQQTISTAGCFTNSASRPLITTPAAPAGWDGPWGPQYLTVSHDPKYLYLSGRYYASVNGGSWLVAACDTGFWADGQVFKINRETGVVTSWIKLDSIPTLAADRGVKIGGGSNGYDVIHGTAIDDSGHVFVCDRLHHRISVYDTNAVLLGTVPVSDPDFVAVSKRTGVIYVISRTQWVNLVLRRFADWRNPGTPTATTVLTTETGDGWKGASAMVLSESDGVTNIWLGYGTIGFRLYRDNITSFSLIRDFSTGDGLMHYDRIAVDRATDQLYWEVYRTAKNGIFTVSDWSNPVMEPVMINGTTFLDGNDITVGPRGNLYCYVYPGGQDYYAWPVYRFGNASTNYAPLNYSNTGKNVSTGKVDFEGTNHRGLAVGWQGQVAVTDYTKFSSVHDDVAIALFSDTGLVDSTYAGRAVLTHTSSKSSGVRFDAAGNMYVGVGIKGPDWSVAPGFETDNFATNYCGSIVKYAPGDTGSISGNVAVGAAKVFSQPFGTYGGDNEVGWCTCWNPRFDADPYGRLYIPNAATCNVAVADNEGNTLHTFGQYGNTDGIEGASPDYVPMAWPYSTAASEDYVYVSDWVNARILRVKMDYQLDNIPGLTDNGTAAEKTTPWKKLAMATSPNPFNPSSAIRVSMPAAGSLCLAVYSADGRLVRTLAQGAFAQGVHNFHWTGVDAAGKTVAAGLYVYRLNAGNRVLITKTVFAK